MVVLKQFEAPDLVESGTPFAVYAGVDCGAVGMSDSEAIARARRRFDYVESRWVDYHIQSWLTTIADPLTDADLPAMFRQAETIASQTYGGYATILLTKALMICADYDQLLHRSVDGGYETVNGTRVASIVESPVATKNFFLTGKITLLRGPIQDRIAPEVQLRDGTCHPRRALAERIYVPLVECLTYSGLATCTPA